MPGVRQSQNAGAEGIVIVQKHRSELPVHVQPPYSKALLRQVGTILQNMGIATVLDEENLTLHKASESERSAIAQSAVSG